MAIYAVIGARGGTGREVVRRLIERPAAEVAEIRAIARGAAIPDDAWPSDERVRRITADIEKPDELRDGLAGAKFVVYAAAGTSYKHCLAVDQEGVRVVAGLCKELGVERMLLVSSQLVHPCNKYTFVRGLINNLVTGPFSSKGIMDFKFVGEQLLRQSGQDYVIVRPGRLVDGPLGNAKACIGQTNGHFMKGASTTRADVAAVCVAALQAPGALNTTFELACEAPVKQADPKLVEVSADFFASLSQDFDKHWPEGREA
mmetsp:Transcript_24949/g.71627  ORF Transcript_24949/g.71627 Transcript_24949/m.71627 type:complete len:259 (-) Transcript_24949:200-976(-)